MSGMGVGDMDEMPVDEWQPEEDVFDPVVVEDIIEAALDVKATGDWTCPCCGWQRSGAPAGQIQCEDCGRCGFDFDLAEPALPEVSTPPHWGHGAYEEGRDLADEDVNTLPGGVVPLWLSEKEAEGLRIIKLDGEKFEAGSD